ncbi:hypothetical protein [Sphingomonas quercus]|uniref:Cysteine rich repeat-containing protein n=1 Tax=Sphingomonas quercus TaxID=2842451 RepID=A0ABS6BJS8_9SPHN|nr:hypothetical protein [Sphingomonas quercus]MBU3077887.1 hypothetical protein [Sphingomonas quercus]
MTKALFPILAGLLIATDAFAQPDQPPPPPPPASRAPRPVAPACAADLARLCAGKSLQQECLVQHWTKISSDCQEALARPMHGGGD